MQEDIDQKLLWVGGKMQLVKEEIDRLIDDKPGSLYATSLVYLQNYRFKSRGNELYVYNEDFNEYDLLVLQDLKEIIKIDDIAFYSIACLFLEEPCQPEEDTQEDELETLLASYNQGLYMEDN